MTTTRTVLRQLLGKMVGDDNQFTTSGAGAAAGVTLVCSSLADKPDDYYNDWWALITSDTYSGEIRRISDFTSATGTVTPYVAFGGIIATSVTFELHRFDPNIKHNALNAAALECYPWLFDPLDDDTLTTNNHLVNGNFEDWAQATYPDYWTLSGAGASCAANTSYFLFGAKSVAVTRAGTDCYLYQNQSHWLRLLDLESQTVNFYCWVKSSVASQARIALYDGTTRTYSDYHTGGGAWELLKVENFAIQEDAATVEPELHVGSSNTVAYFDHARLLGPYLYEYRLPTDFAENPTQVFVQTISDIAGDADKIGETAPPVELHDWQVVDDGTNRLLKMGAVFESNQKLILRGPKKFTSMSADTSTVGINAPKTTLLCDYAAFWLYRQMVNSATAEDVGRYRQLMADWQATFKDERGRYEVPLKNPMARFSYRA